MSWENHHHHITEVSKYLPGRYEEAVGLKEVHLVDGERLHEGEPFLYQLRLVHH